MQKNKLVRIITKLNLKKAKMNSNIRKSHTRTKIQLGGLIIKSGLADLLEINLGDDLQLDLDQRDKSYIILGILDEVTRQIQNDKSSMSYYLSKGKNISNIS